jgi:hypothetical protein
MTIVEYSPFESVVLNSINDVKKYWSFFLEGFRDASFRLDDTRRLEQESFLKFMLDVVDKGAPHGVVYLVRYKGAGKPLAFGIINNNSSPYRCRSALFHWYSTKQDVNASGFTRKFAEEWAKTNGYEELTVISTKVTGSSYEKFEKRWGFTRRFIVFGKKL